MENLPSEGSKSTISYLDFDDLALPDIRKEYVSICSGDNEKLLKYLT